MSYQTVRIEEIMSDWGTFIPEYRKAWQSSYDPKFQTPMKPREHQSQLAGIDSLPSNRWVKPRIPEGSKTQKLEVEKAIQSWLRENKIKYRSCLIEHDSSIFWVYIFKRISDAVLFKLSWG
jgi:hypothetical protein